MRKRRGAKASGNETVVGRLTGEFVKKMQATDFATQDPKTLTATIQQFTQDMAAAATPGGVTNFVPVSSLEEWTARCRAFCDAITQAKDQAATWKSFEKLAGR